MAIAFTASRDLGQTAIAAQEGSTASFTGTSGSMLVLSFVGWRTDSAQPTLESITGQGVSWQVVTSVDIDTVAPNQGTLWVAMAQAAGVTGAVTVRFGSEIANWAWTVEEFTGIRATKPWVQSGTDTDNTTPEDSAVLAAFAKTSNRPFHVRAKNSATTAMYTMNGTWTKLQQQAGGVPGTNITTGWDDNPTTSASWTQVTGTATAGGIILEMDAVEAGGVWFVP